MRLDLFHLSERGTTWQREILGGTTTFMTMGYIIFVQPTLLQAAGMDPGAVMVATCLASALATFCMGLLANYPIALAPGMGHNVFFSYTVVLTLGYTWQQALGATFISGGLFLLLSCFGLRESLIRALPSSLKNAIAVGIGLLISLVGLEWSGIVTDHPATLVGLGDLTSPPVLLSLFGLTVITILMTRGWYGAILVGILLSLLAGDPNPLPARHPRGARKRHAFNHPADLPAGPLRHRRYALGCEPAGRPAPARWESSPRR